MLNLIVANFVSSIILYVFGNIFQKYIFNQKNNKVSFEESGIWGFIFLSFLSLLLNFLTPLTKTIGNILVIFSLIYFLVILFNSTNKKKILILILSVSFVSLLLIFGSNINRPDAGLYHIPYLKIIQENKIILGLTNIHHRFGHTSVTQYISAIYNTNFFNERFFNLPVASLFGFYFYYLYDFLIKNKELQINYNFFIYLISIFSLLSFNRYSGYGNDAPAHLFVLLGVILFLKNYNLCQVDFGKVFLLSIFSFGTKSFMIINIFFAILLYIICNKKKIHIIKIINKKIAFSFLFLFLIITKNILISGCIIYPLEQSCFSKLSFVDLKKTKTVAIEGEAWAKEIKNQSIKKIPKEVYIKKFIWVDVWLQNHFKIIIEKLTPFIIVLLILLSFKFIINRNINFKNINKNNFHIFFIMLALVSIWFVKFPLYRFGASYLGLFLISISFILINQIESLSHKKFNNFCIIIISIVLTTVIAKNIKRVSDISFKDPNSYPWPKIYTLGDRIFDKPDILKKITNKNGEFLYFYSEKECMYNSAPCSNFLHENLNSKYILGYKVIFKN